MSSLTVVGFVVVNDVDDVIAAGTVVVDVIIVGFSVDVIIVGVSVDVIVVAVVGVVVVICSVIAAIVSCSFCCSLQPAF